jgi:hypothetical protein
MGIVELRPGGLLAFQDRPSGGRRDLYVAEPPWDRRRLVVRDVADVRFGQDRVLAIAHKIGGDNADGSGAGELLLVDLATGDQAVARATTS